MNCIDYCRLQLETEQDAAQVYTKQIIKIIVCVRTLSFVWLSPYHLRSSLSCHFFYCSSFVWSSEPSNKFLYWPLHLCYSHGIFTTLAGKIAITGEGSTLTYSHTVNFVGTASYYEGAVNRTRLLCDIPWSWKEVLSFLKHGKGTVVFPFSSAQIPKPLFEAFFSNLSIYDVDFILPSIIPYSILCGLTCSKVGCWRLSGRIVSLLCMGPWQIPRDPHFFMRFGNLLDISNELVRLFAITYRPLYYTHFLYVYILCILNHC